MITTGALETSFLRRAFLFNSSALSLFSALTRQYWPALFNVSITPHEKSINSSVAVIENNGTTSEVSLYGPTKLEVTLVLLTATRV